MEAFVNLGFDRDNLSAAVEQVMSLAKERNQDSIWLMGGANTREFSLTDEAQVRDYLMLKSQAVYEKAANGVVAQIRDVVYFSIGVVFEENAGGMYPEPLTLSGERSAHLAYFWQVLGR
jgi:hypothetical protein